MCRGGDSVALVARFRLIFHRLGERRAGGISGGHIIASVQQTTPPGRHAVGALIYNVAMGSTDRHREQTSAPEAGQTNLERTLDRLKEGVGRLVKAELERDVHANIVNIVGRRLGLNHVRILQSKIVARPPELQDAIDDAEGQNLITEAQGSHLEQTDVILAARRKSDREAVHVAVEVSSLIGEHDINRARERADTLAIVKGTPAIPAVVGGSIEPPQRALADRQGVSVVITLRLSD